MGQWSQGGMIMIGDMFNQGLKHRVDALCNELADFLRSQPLGGVKAARFQSQSQSGSEEVSLYVAGTGSASGWWPEERAGPSLRHRRAHDFRILPATGRRSVAYLHEPIRARTRRRFGFDFSAERSLSKPVIPRFRDAVTNAWMCTTSSGWRSSGASCISRDRGDRKDD